MENVKKWYVLCTKPRYERKVADSLEKKKIPCYYPRYKQIQYWQEKRKVVNVSLFKSLVFVYTSESEHVIIKQMDGVSGVLYWLQKPATISEEEILTIRNFLKQNNNIKLEKIQIDSDRENSEPFLQRQMGEVINIGIVAKAILPSLGYMLISESVVEEVKIVA